MPGDSRPARAATERRLGSLRGVFWPVILLIGIGSTLAYGSVSRERMDCAGVEGRPVRALGVGARNSDPPIPAYSAPLQSDCKSTFYGIPSAKYKTYVRMA